MFQLQELVRLHRMGTKCHKSARFLGISPNTERVYRRALDAAGLLQGSGELPSEEQLLGAIKTQLGSGERMPLCSSLGRWLEQIREWHKNGAQPKAIYERLRREESDFDGSLSAVKRACLRRKREQGVQESDVVIPVITAPGHIAQVDFGYVGKLLDPAKGVLRKAWVFVMVLGHSRHLFCEIVFDQSIETWLSLHANAFEWFGGVPETVVPDNLKSAVIKAAFTPSETAILNRNYREQARHFGFKIDPTPPYSPQKKGKVESAVNYVKKSFFDVYGSSLDAEELGVRLKEWVLKTAGTRIHGTTGKRPLSVFRTEEESALQALPPVPYEMVTWRRAKIRADSHVPFEGVLYSVPWRWIGKDGWLRATKSSVQVHIENLRVATHRIGLPGEHVTNEEHLPQGRRDLRHRSRGYWLGRADEIGPKTGCYVREILESDDVLCLLRRVQSIVMYLEEFPPHRAEAACARAAFFSNYSTKAVKQILTKGLESEALPVLSLHLNSEKQAPPRHARNIQQMLEQQIEESHGTN